jgi:hypothetical protein
VQVENQNKRYYTAKEAQIALGLNKAKFHKWVRQGLIPKVLLPGMKQGRYPKRDVDALALSLNEAPKPFDFSPSSPADQMEEITIAQKYFEQNMILPLPIRLVLQQRTHFAFHSLKVRGQPVGYIALFRLPEELLNTLLTGQNIFQNVRPEDVLPLVRLEPFRVYFDAIVIDPALPSHLRRLYAGTLLYQMADHLLYLCANDYQITGLYAIPYTLEGEQLVLKLGFQPWESLPMLSRHRAYEYLLNAQGLQSLQKMCAAYHRYRPFAGD